MRRCTALFRADMCVCGVCECTGYGCLIESLPRSAGWPLHPKICASFFFLVLSLVFCICKRIKREYVGMCTRLTMRPFFSLSLSCWALATFLNALPLVLLVVPWPVLYMTCWLARSHYKLAACRLPFSLDRMMLKVVG